MVNRLIDFRFPDKLSDLLAESKLFTALRLPVTILVSNKETADRITAVLEWCLTEKELLYVDVKVPEQR